MQRFMQIVGVSNTELNIHNIGSGHEMITLTISVHSISRSLVGCHGSPFSFFAGQDGYQLEVPHHPLHVYIDRHSDQIL